MIVEFRGLSLWFTDDTPAEVVKRAIDEAFDEIDRVARLEAELGELRGALGAAVERLERAERGHETWRRVLFGEHGGNLAAPDSGLVAALHELRGLAEQVGASAETLEGLDRHTSAIGQGVSEVAAELGALERALDWPTTARLMSAALALDTGDEARSVAYDRAATLYRAAGAEPPAVDREYTPDELEAIRTAPGPHDEDEAEFAKWARKAIRDLQHAVRKRQRAEAAAEG